MNLIPSHGGWTDVRLRERNTQVSVARIMQRSFVGAECANEHYIPKSEPDHSLPRVPYRAAPKAGMQRASRFWVRSTFRRSHVSANRTLMVPYHKERGYHHVQH